MRVKYPIKDNLTESKVPNKRQYYWYIVHAFYAFWRVIKFVLRYCFVTCLNIKNCCKPSSVFMYLHFVRAGNSLICSSLICSFRSFCSNQMSDCERFAQIAQDKWATVSESLRSLKTNERSWANRSFLGKKRAIRSENLWANSQPCILSCSLKKKNVPAGQVLFSSNIRIIRSDSQTATLF